MNIASAINFLHPNAVSMIDFIVRDDSDGEGQYIALWGLEEPEPTEEELQAAWDAYQDYETNKPPEVTELDRIGEQLVQRELEALELRNQNGIIGGQLVERELEAAELRVQNEVLGAQMVEKELQIMDIKAQNGSLGESLVGFELRLLSLETPTTEGEKANV